MYRNKKGIGLLPLIIIIALVGGAVLLWRGSLSHASTKYDLEELNSELEAIVPKKKTKKLKSKSPASLAVAELAVTEKIEVKSEAQLQIDELIEFAKAEGLGEEFEKYKATFKMDSPASSFTAMYLLLTSHNSSDSQLRDRKLQEIRDYFDEYPQDSVTAMGEALEQVNKELPEAKNHILHLMSEVAKKDPVAKQIMKFELINDYKQLKNSDAKDIPLLVMLSVDTSPEWRAEIKTALESAAPEVDLDAYVPPPAESDDTLAQ